MIVSQLDEDGFFVAAVEADESPLEPGVFLIPGGAIDEPPPSIPPGMKACWLGGEWLILQQDIGAGVSAPIQPPEVARGVALRSAARVLLDESDITVLRCAEAGVPVPQAWRDYRTALRSIVSSQSLSESAQLPTKPDYPPGT